MPSLSFCFNPSVNKGDLSIPLAPVVSLAPLAQVVVYTVLPGGETTADSKNFPVQLCLNNKVTQGRSICTVWMNKLGPKIAAGPPPRPELQGT